MDARVTGAPGATTVRCGALSVERGGRYVSIEIALEAISGGRAQAPVAPAAARAESVPAAAARSWSSVSTPRSVT